MNFHGIQQTLAGDNELLGLLLQRQGTNQRGHFFGGLPLRQLRETLLARPHRGVNDLQEQLACAGVEDEDRAVDGLGHQVALKGLVRRDTVHVRVVHKPDDLVGEELGVVLRGQIRLRGLRTVQLQTLADTLAEHIHSRIVTDELRHGLLHERLGSGEPVAVAGVQVVTQVKGAEHTGGGGIQGHVVCGVVQELRAGIALDIVGIKVAPAELHVNPELAASGAFEAIFGVVEQRGLGDVPLVRREQHHIGARRVHLVRLSRVDGLLLHGLNLQRVELLVEHLA